MESRKLTLKRYDISYLRFIFEGYDGLGIISTVEQQQAQSLVLYPACRRATVLELLQALQEEGIIKEVCEV